jgi:hypothetical protein
MSENGEYHTPKEEAEIKIDLLARDAWLSITDLSKAHQDPLYREFVERHEADLWSMDTKIRLLLSAIDALRKTNLRVVANG